MNLKHENSYFHMQGMNLGFCSDFDCNSSPAIANLNGGATTKPIQNSTKELSALDALKHYVDSSGTSKEALFKQLRTKAVTPEQFEKIKEAIDLAGFDGGHAELFITDTMSYRTQKGSDEWLAFGNVTLQISGTLRVQNGNYSFDGTLSALNDIYDFDSKAWGTRSIPGELMTRGGALLPGKPYVIEFKGERNISSQGAIKSWY